MPVQDKELRAGSFLDRDGWRGGGLVVVGVEVQRRAAELGALQNLNMEAGGKRGEKCLQRRAEASGLQ